MRMRLRFALALALLGLGAASLLAQSPAGPIHPNARAASQPSAKTPPKTQAQQQIPNSGQRLRVRVSLVTLPVAVSDSSGHFVLDLTQKDFQIYDDGKPQQITHFDQGGDPLSIVLVIETGAQVAPLLPAVRKTGIIFTQMVMTSTGETAVIGYNDEIDVLRTMTTDSDSVLSAIQHIKPGLQGARLYDAMSRAVTMLENEPPERRRVMVIVGEKNDHGSETKLGDVLRRAQLANVTIYTVGLSTTAAAFRQKPEEKKSLQVSPQGTYPVPPPPGTMQTPDVVSEQLGNGPGGAGALDLMSLVAWMVQHGANIVGRNSLVLASAATGGLHVGTFRDRAIENAMNKIGNDLHGEYLLAYHPGPDVPSGYHNIEVRVLKPDMKVRTRPGYYLAPGQ